MYFTKQICVRTEEGKKRISADLPNDDDDECQTERRESETCRWQSFLFSFMPYDVHRCILLFQDPDWVNEGKGFITQDETGREREREEGQQLQVLPYFGRHERGLCSGTVASAWRGVCFFLRSYLCSLIPLKGRPLVFNTHTHGHKWPCFSLLVWPIILRLKPGGERKAAGLQVAWC